MRKFSFGYLVPLMLLQVPVAHAKDGAPVVLETSIPAAGVTRLAIAAGQGNVRIEGADIETLEWRVTLLPANSVESLGDTVLGWFFEHEYETEAELIAAVRLASVMQDGTLSLSLDPGRSTREDRVVEEWVVRMPRAMAVEVDQWEGDLAVSGIAGGLDARLNVGDATLDIASGYVAVSVNVGDIALTYGSHDLGAVRLASSVGRTDYTISGMHIDRPRAPGSGDRFGTDGAGQFDITLLVSVGNVEAEIR